MMHSRRTAFRSSRSRSATTGRWRTVRRRSPRFATSGADRGRSWTDAVHRAPSDARRADSRRVSRCTGARSSSRRMPDDLIDAAVSAFENVPSPLSALLIEQFGGAVSRVPRDATAFDQRDSDYNLVIVSRWTDPARRRAERRWARSTSTRRSRSRTGRVYVNYIGAGESPDRVRAAFGAGQVRAARRRSSGSTIRRIVFRMNQNIPPE